MVFWGVAAVLLFWSVGAYNRLVRLRHALTRRFATVDQQCEARTAALLRLAEVLAAEPDAGSAPHTLRSACAQADAARAHARMRPAVAGTITSLRLAEDILADARARIAGAWPASEPAQALRAELAAVDTTLAFARRQFNEAVAQYNRAVGQFPTWLVAGPFGFRSAGLL
jgi:LemA protein